MKTQLLLCALATLTACGGDTTGPGVPTRLAFTVQPSSAWSTGVISPPVRVAVQDREGTTVSTATTSITVTITAGSGTTGAVLGGTLTVAAVSGVAAFDSLTVDRQGTGYTLTATASGLTSATSNIDRKPPPTAP